MTYGNGSCGDGLKRFAYRCRSGIFPVLSTVIASGRDSRKCEVLFVCDRELRRFWRHPAVTGCQASGIFVFNRFTNLC